jgi:hypothetical protein
MRCIRLSGDAALGGLVDVPVPQLDALGNLDLCLGSELRLS